MAQAYNPIVRTFCQFRASVLRYLDIDRHAIRPETPLETILPVPIRRAVWEDLHQKGLRPPPLQFSRRDHRRMTWAVLEWTVSAILHLRSVWGLLVAFPLAFAVSWTNRRRAVHLSHEARNVGELVISMTCFADHKDSGYRWTRNEIELKVRLVLAESLGLDLDEVRPESTLAGLEAKVCNVLAPSKPVERRRRLELGNLSLEPCG